MKLRMFLFTAAIAASVAPASAAPPSATGRIRDTGYAEVYSDGPDGFAYAFMNYEVISEPDPAFDPGSLFPIVVDPNNPPVLPANVVQDSFILSGYMTVCDWSIGTCSDGPISNADMLSIEATPLPGNAIRIAGTVNLDGGLGPIDLPIDVRAARPAVTRLWTDNAIVHPNIWTDGDQAHAGTDTYAPLITRHTYSVTGTLGSDPVTYGTANFNREVDAFTSADVPA